MEHVESHQQAFEAWRQHKGNARQDTTFAAEFILRQSHPDLHLTRVNPDGCELIPFANAGHASAVRTDDADFEGTRRYIPPASRLDTKPGSLEDKVIFARYDYTWQAHTFVVYDVIWDGKMCGDVRHYYVLAQPGGPGLESESEGLGLVVKGYHKHTEALLIAAGEWSRDLHEQILVFDNACWSKSRPLWESAQAASWDDVILEHKMKASLIADVTTFFDSREMYKLLSVPWKRGMILHGTPGNGKTVTIKALINTLADRPEMPVQSLYVKSLDSRFGPKYCIDLIFSRARKMAPCLLIFEDLDSLVADKTRSYFLNEVDGLESNDGILMIGSTNHIEKLDPAVTKRPSRFDRKYHYRLPARAERIAYAQYWRNKFTDSQAVDFPEDICPIIADLTDGFSFAYLKELFIMSLLFLARGPTGPEVAVEAGSATSDAASQKNATAQKVTSLSPTQKATKHPSAPRGSPWTRLLGLFSGRQPTQGRTGKKKGLPTVDIPVELQDNLFLQGLQSQAAILLAEMGSELQEEEKFSEGPAIEYIVPLSPRRIPFF